MFPQSLLLGSDNRDSAHGFFSSAVITHRCSIEGAVHLPAHPPPSSLQGSGETGFGNRTSQSQLFHLRSYLISLSLFLHLWIRMNIQLSQGSAMGIRRNIRACVWSTVTAQRRNPGTEAGTISAIIDSFLPLTNEQAQCGDLGEENNFCFRGTWDSAGGTGLTS